MGLTAHSGHWESLPRPLPEGRRRRHGDMQVSAAHPEMYRVLPEALVVLCICQTIQYSCALCGHSLRVRVRAWLHALRNSAIADTPVRQCNAKQTAANVAGGVDGCAGNDAAETRGECSTPVEPQSSAHGLRLNGMQPIAVQVSRGELVVLNSTEV
jgi:hypothetical protein